MELDVGGLVKISFGPVEADEAKHLEKEIGGHVAVSDREPGLNCSVMASSVCAQLEDQQAQGLITSWSVTFSDDPATGTMTIAVSARKPASAEVQDLALNPPDEAVQEPSGG